MLSVLGFLIIALKVFFGFSLLVLIHEFGHFIVAKLSGVWVEEFGLGLPPRIFGKKIGETFYSLNLFPIGGFVKLHGEVGEDKITYPERAFVNKSKKVRVAITLAGIVMNLVLAVVCFSVVYSIRGIELPTKDIKILEISAGSPAELGGFSVGDVVKKVGEKEVENTQKFIDEIGLFKGKKVNVVVERTFDSNQKETKTLVLTPRVNPPEGQGPLGVVVADAPQVYYPPLWQRPFVGTYYGFKSALFWIRATAEGLGSAAKDVTQGKAPQGLVGIVGIFAIFIEIAKISLIDLINFIGVVSVNLAIFNLIPFPPLDGSRILLVIYEAVFKKKIKPVIESRIHAIGMILLLILVFLLTSREIPRLIRAGSISGFVNSLGK